MKKKTKCSDSGATLVEYSILVATIALLILVAMPRLLHSLELVFVDIEMSLDMAMAGGSTRTGGTNPCVGSTPPAFCFADEVGQETSVGIGPR